MSLLVKCPSSLPDTTSDEILCQVNETASASPDSRLKEKPTLQLLDRISQQRPTLQETLSATMSTQQKPTLLGDGMASQEEE